MSYLQRRLRSSDDAGFAMMSVLFFLLIVTVLSTGIVALSTNFAHSSKHEASFQDALAAAEAGVDDFSDRLDADYNYALDATGSATGGSDGNTALRTQSACTGKSDFKSNPASYGTKISVGSPGYYCYWVDTSHLTSVGDASYGELYLNVTGAVQAGNSIVTRTIQVGLKPYGFLDALSSSDYNLVDPVLQQEGGGVSVAQTVSDCVYHAYDPNPTDGGRGPNPSRCSNLINYWITGNKFLGPMQSNDEFYLCGTPDFEDHVYSGDPNSGDHPFWVDPYGCGGDQPTFAQDGGTIIGNKQVQFPPAATTIKTQDTIIGQTGSGCLYTGPTSITLNGATMTVYSPETKSTNPGCVGSNVSLPPNGTIYVQNIPSATSDPNYASSCSTSYPVLDTSNNVTPDTCMQGDAFIQGDTSRQLTVAADNNIYITGNLTYDDIKAQNPRPVVGLIATNTIDIYHPVTNNSGNCSTGVVFGGGGGCQQTGVTASSSNCSGYGLDGGGYCNFHGTVNFDAKGDPVQFSSPLVNVTVDAAMLSLNHSFAVENFTQGTASDLGSVNLDGAVAGKFMDIEGVFGGNGQMQNGYGVNYVYDTRFENGGLVPPNFLDPTKTFWHRVSYADCSSSNETCTSSS